MHLYKNKLKTIKIIQKVKKYSKYMQNVLCIIGNYYRNILFLI